MISAYMSFKNHWLSESTERRVQFELHQGNF
jgi:hypothetical protein